MSSDHHGITQWPVPIFNKWAHVSHRSSDNKIGLDGIPMTYTSEEARAVAAALVVAADYVDGLGK